MSFDFLIIWSVLKKVLRGTWRIILVVFFVALFAGVVYVLRQIPEDALWNGDVDIIEEAGNLPKAFVNTLEDVGDFVKGVVDENIINYKTELPDIHFDLPSPSLPSLAGASAPIDLDTSHSRQEETSVTAKDLDGNMFVEVLDVGQADAILLYTDDCAMLVDAGNNADGEPVLEYIQEDLGINALDYLIVTHAHEDHCGGADTILGGMEVKNVMLPLLPTETKTYQSVLASAEESNANLLSPAVGDIYEMDGAVISILSCETVTDDEDPNQSSIVVRVDYGKVSLLLTGDAETENELAMIDAGVDLDCDILKVGHHGSFTSSSAAFISAVSPELAVISCGKDNDYGHPHEESLEILRDNKAEIIRTDEVGTVRIVINGSTYAVSSFATETDGNAA